MRLFAPRMQGMRTKDPQNLVDRLTGQMRHKPMTGAWVPGQRLSEAALSESLAVSRNTLREAFRLLTKEGLLVHEPHKGVAVATPSMAAIIDIYRVRRLIECQALAQAFPGHPARGRMQAAVDAAAQCRQRNDWPAAGTANMDFHMAIVELADSERLNTLFAHVLAELRLAFGLIRDPEYLHAPFVDRNQTILDLFDAGRLQEAAQALDEYLAHSERIILAAYARSLDKT